MFLTYVDESGSPDGHAEPLLSGQTPLFVLSSLVLHADKWRSVDRTFRDLKKRFFSKEIGSGRAENYEVKGTSLIRPGNQADRRRHTFVRSTLELCLSNQMAGFAVVFKKSPIRPPSKTSIYTMGLQYLVERVSTFLEETSVGITAGHDAQHGQTIIIADTRMRNLDLNVATSHLSFIFGHTIGQQCQRVIEAPTFTHSEISVGIQLTDIFGACLYARNYNRSCRTIGNALDYSHMADTGPYLDLLEWKSQKAYNGYFIHGYRFIDHSTPP
jgi:hypothetical protein